MPSLKDIKTRIESVKTTRQVTSAMKMVSAAKLKKAQDNIVKLRPYAEKLNDIIFDLLNNRDDDHNIELADQRVPDKVLIVMISSNRGLCGAFNSNIAKTVNNLILKQYGSHLKNGFIDVISIGKQGQKLLKSLGIECKNEYNSLYNDINYREVEKLSNKIIKDFINHKYDRVILVYNEFINAAAQQISTAQFLPMELPETNYGNSSQYLFEPGEKEIIEELVPQALKTMFFKTILESIASEHGARMTSMHKATDNATELIKDLELSYNKARQASITNEILEIVGGAEALAK